MDSKPIKIQCLSLTEPNKVFPIVTQIVTSDLFAKNKTQSVAKILGIFEQSPTPSTKSFVIIEEFGELSLEEFLQKTALPSENPLSNLTDAMAISVEIAKTLESLKTIGVAHRNLNPRNIALNPNDEISQFFKICSFENCFCSQIHSQEYASHLWQWSEGYTAPEIDQNTGYPMSLPVDHFGFDVFSFGMIAMKLIGEDTLNEQLKKASKDKARLLAEFIIKCMEEKAPQRVKIEEVRKIARESGRKISGKILSLIASATRNKTPKFQEIEEVLEFFTEKCKIPQFMIVYCRKALNALDSETFSSRENPKYYKISLILAENLIEDEKSKESIEILRNLDASLPVSLESNFKLNILKNFGLAYKEIGEMDKSLDFYQKALELSSEKSEKSFVLQETARIFLSKGDIAKAFETIVSAGKLFEDQKPISSQFDYIMLKSQILREKGDLDLAVKTLETLLGSIRDLAQKAKISENLAILFLKKKELSRADVYAEKAAEMITQAFGDKSFEMARSYHLIAKIAQRKKDFSKSLSFYGRALSLKRELLEPEDLLISNELTALGKALTSAQRFNEALDCHEEAYKIRKKKLGKQSLKVAASIINLAKVYIEMDCEEKALELHRIALGIRSSRNPNSFSTAQSYYNIGECQFKMDQFELAENSFEAACRILRNLKGDRSRELADCYIRKTEAYAQRQLSNQLQPQMILNQNKQENKKEREDKDKSDEEDDDADKCRRTKRVIKKSNKIP